MLGEDVAVEDLSSNTKANRKALPHQGALRILPMGCMTLDSRHHEVTHEGEVDGVHGEGVHGEMIHVGVDHSKLAHEAVVREG